MSYTARDIEKNVMEMVFGMSRQVIESIGLDPKSKEVEGIFFAVFASFGTGVQTGLQIAMLDPMTARQVAEHLNVSHEGTDNNVNALELLRRLTGDRTPGRINFEPPAEAA